MASGAGGVEAVQRIAVVPTILDTVCRLTGMGFAAIAHVSEEKWIACSVRDDIDFGLAAGGELKLETTICNEIRQCGEPVIISDVVDDEAYRDHHTPAMYGFRSYISMPIKLPDGSFFGTLCAIDPQPRDLARAEVQHTFRMFADLLGFHLNAADKLIRSERRLASEIEAGELREQFIAVLGHDLRNPLASVQAGIAMLSKAPQSESAPVILEQMQGSIDRMAKMINNILDFARGRLGGGLTLDRQITDVATVVRQAVQELASSHPEQSIILGGCDAPIAAYCDAQRVGQLVSNLLANALTHGATDQPITVNCTIEADQLVLSVANAGEEIPASARSRLFHPFVRGKAGADREGLGLGLYIASEIASAHGGQIGVSSSPQETRFVARMPVEAS
ncbi:GAF domain-containing sensor histidine kinase [Novosphingobium sp. RD2P27]|uniref:histidine kinase n=1 Tax=Novosphingobium kalidii TaxID=3230299 RepID=A0ABV2D5K1_9SPHN